MTWAGLDVPMKIPKAPLKESYYVRRDQDNPDYDKVKRILDAKYDPADIERYSKECTHLSLWEQAELHAVLKEFEDLFDGTLGR